MKIIWDDMYFKDCWEKLSASVITGNRLKTIDLFTSFVDYLKVEVQVGGKTKIIQLSLEKLDDFKPAETHTLIGQFMDTLLPSEDSDEEEEKDIKPVYEPYVYKLKRPMKIATAVNGKKASHKKIDAITFSVKTSSDVIAILAAGEDVKIREVFEKTASVKDGTTPVVLWQHLSFVDGLHFATKVFPSFLQRQKS